MTPNPKPRRSVLAVLISDVHYHVNTIRLADLAMSAAIDEAARPGVPLIIMGDLLDTKAIIRGEVAKALIKMLQYAALRKVQVAILMGNHDKINEKGLDHSLEFLRPWAQVIDKTCAATALGDGFAFIPYQSSCEAFREQLAMIQPGWTVLAHQGVQGAYMGEYVVDKSSMKASELAEFAFISGHYHRTQTLYTDGDKRAEKFGVGSFTYVGSPYSTTFAEAKDPPKGFAVLYSDSSLEFKSLRLRKHVILELQAADLLEGKLLAEGFSGGDLVWVKASGSCADLDSLKKKDVIALLPPGMGSVKLDKFPVDAARPEADTKATPGEMLDAIIDASVEPNKKSLKSLWRELINENR